MNNHLRILFLVVVLMVTSLYILNYKNIIEEQGGITQDMWNVEQEKRKLTLQKACDAMPTNMKGDEKSQDWDKFWYDPETKFLYCPIPKHGGTTWSSTLGVMHDKFHPESLEQFRKLEEEKPLIMMVARHPFERLMSAHLDKIHVPNNKKPFIEFLETVVIPDYERNHCHPGLPCAEMNMHWRPVTGHCFPCHVPWTVICKMETFTEDRRRVHSLLGLENLNQRTNRVQLNMHGGNGTSDLTREEFDKVPEEVKNRLREIYYWDFKLFDYDPFLYT